MRGIKNKSTWVVEKDLFGKKGIIRTTKNTFIKGVFKPATSI